MRKFSVFTLLFILLFLVKASNAQATYSLPPSRITNWQGAGVVGGIPNVTNICQTVHSLVNARDSNALSNGHNDATNINNAINNCFSNGGGVVYLPDSAYNIGNITMKSNVVLRGSGPKTTIIYGWSGSCPPYIWQNAGSGGNMINIVSSGPSYAFADYGDHPNHVISSGYTKGSNVITLAEDGFSVGELMVINQQDDHTIPVSTYNCPWCDSGYGSTGSYQNEKAYMGLSRAMGQVSRVMAKGGGPGAYTFTIEPPIYWDYKASLTPWAIHYQGYSGPIENVGVENLQLYLNNTCYNTPISISGAYNTWVRNIEINYTDWDGMLMTMAYSSHCSIVDNYFHDAFQHTSGADSTFSIGGYSSANLIQNNIFTRHHVGIIPQWGAVGNVIAYNYMFGDFDDNTYDIASASIVFHGAHPMFNLMEGNIATGMGDDSVWGSSSHQTFFRNWLMGTSLICAPHDGTRATLQCSPVGGEDQAGVKAWYGSNSAMGLFLNNQNRNTNSVGNVLGSYPLLHNTYKYSIVGGGLQPVIKNQLWPGYSDRWASSYEYNIGYGGGWIEPDPHNYNSDCTAVGNPYVCCTGSATGTCSDWFDMNAIYCTGNKAPYGCCTGVGTGTCPKDSTAVFDSTIIQGDYTYSDATNNWAYGGFNDPNASDHNLPTSMYLSSKPSWFGNIPWPPIGPDVTGGQDTSGHVYDIPAKYCYDHGQMPNCLEAGKDTTPPAAPTGLVVN